MVRAAGEMQILKLYFEENPLFLNVCHISVFVLLISISVFIFLSIFFSLLCLFVSMSLFMYQLIFLLIHFFLIYETDAISKKDIYYFCNTFLGCLFMNLCIYLFIFYSLLYLLIYLSTFLSIYVSSYLLICLFIYLFIPFNTFLFTNLFIYSLTYFYFYLYFYFCILVYLFINLFDFAIFLYLQLVELKAVFYEMKALNITALPTLRNKSNQFEFCLHGLKTCQGLIVSKIFYLGMQ